MEEALADQRCKVTPLQVAERQLGAEAPSFFAIGGRLIREQGVRGLWKGVAPRLMNVALWVSQSTMPSIFLL